MSERLKEFFLCKRFGPFRFFVHGLVEYSTSTRSYHFAILNPKDWFWGRYKDEGCYLDGWGLSPLFSVFWS